MVAAGYGSTKLYDPAYDPYVIAVGGSDGVGTPTTDDDIVPSRSTSGDGQRDPDVLAPASPWSASGCPIRGFEPGMGDPTSAREAQITELNRAIRNGELFTVHQPLTNLRTGRPSGAEALVRRQHPGDGVVGPDQFIGLAEETGPDRRDPHPGAPRGMPSGGPLDRGRPEPGLTTTVTSRRGSWPTPPSSARSRRF